MKKIIVGLASFAIANCIFAQLSARKKWNKGYDSGYDNGFEVASQEFKEEDED